MDLSTYITVSLSWQASSVEGASRQRELVLFTSTNAGICKKYVIYSGSVRGCRTRFLGRRIGYRRDPETGGSPTGMLIQDRQLRRALLRVSHSHCQGRPQTSQRPCPTFP